MVSTQIPDKISVRLLPVSNDLQVIRSVTALRVFQAWSCYAVDQAESVSSFWNCLSFKILNNSVHRSLNLEFTVFFLGQVLFLFKLITYFKKSLGTRRKSISQLKLQRRQKLPYPPHTESLTATFFLCLLMRTRKKFTRNWILL